MPPLVIATLPLWNAMPPEVNTARLMTGAGPAPMLQAAAGWESLAILLETQADELAGSLAALTAAWSGAASERAIMATMPMILWLRTTSAQAAKRSLQAVTQANAYTAALASTPPIPEIEQNHITHGVLEATNFLGINGVPIAINEADYVRMWNQAAGVMAAYQAETAMNVLFEPMLPMQPIVIPGVGQAAMGAAIGRIGAQAPGAALRNASIAQVGSQAALESAALSGGRAVGQANMAAQRGQGQLSKAENAARQGADRQDQALQQGAQQGAQLATQMASQLGSTLGQLPQQLGQQLAQPMQQLTAPLQQVSSMFGQLGGPGGNEGGAQLGLLGASPFSNHPALGGSGASSGAGLVRAASLPGAGGSAARTPLMASLLAGPAVSPVAVAAGGAAGPGAMGAAPVAAGAGMGPMGMLGQRGKSAGNRTGLEVPAPLAHDFGEDDGDEW